MGDTVNPHLKERLRQLVEAATFAAGGALVPGIIGLLSLPHPTWEQISLVLRMAAAAGLVPFAAYFKTKARVIEAHLPELGSRGDRHNDPPPPPLAVVAVAQAAVAGMKNGANSSPADKL
jgi:hypothetical protein